MTCLWYTFLVFIVGTELFAAQLRHGTAKINYCNAKYVKDCYAITRRVRRGEPYKSNFTIALLHTWNNNVTFKAVLYQGGIPIEIVKTKVCDAVEVDWLFQFFKTHSTNIDFRCPFKPAIYALVNLEFPPKNTPQSIMKILKNEFYCKLYFHITKTEEMILESTIAFQYKQ